MRPLRVQIHWGGLCGHSVHRNQTSLHQPCSGVNLHHQSHPSRHQPCTEVTKAATNRAPSPKPPPTVHHADPSRQQPYTRVTRITQAATNRSPPKPWQRPHSIRPVDGKWRSSVIKLQVNGHQESDPRRHISRKRDTKYLSLPANQFRGSTSSTGYTLPDSGSLGTKLLLMQAQCSAVNIETHISQFNCFIAYNANYSKLSLI